MAWRGSTALCNGMLNNLGIKEMFTDGVIYCYSGTQPAKADLAPTGTLLGKCTVNGGAFAFGSPTNGLEFDAPVAGILSKAAAETWQIKGEAVGTLGWFRLMRNASDSLALDNSATYPRLDGRISLTGGGGEMTVATMSIIVDQIITVDTATLQFPASFFT